jgi:hypothetical protein
MTTPPTDNEPRATEPTEMSANLDAAVRYTHDGSMTRDQLIRTQALSLAISSRDYLRKYELDQVVTIAETYATYIRGDE